MTQSLTPAEDQTLRTLHWMESFGVELSEAHSALKAEIQGRDLRAVIRDAEKDVVILLPAEAVELEH